MVANLKTVVFYCGILTAENVGTLANYRGSFTTLAPGAHLLKIFYSASTKWTNKLERLSLSFPNIYGFGSGAYPSGEPLKGGHWQTQQGPMF